MSAYTYNGPVNCDSNFDTSNAKGKTAVVTGGANGMGEEFVRALTAAGAFVIFGDIDEECGKKIEADLKGAAQFVKCDVTKFKDQVAMFKQALANSPNKRVDIAIANAGIVGYDDMFFHNIEQEDPEEPNLRILNVNGIGTLFTTKIALHYFHRQFAADQEASKDQVLILQGSVAGYLDVRGAVQYGFSKYGLRSVMKNLRITEPAHGIRVNFIGPWYIKTKIMPAEVITQLEQAGVEFAEAEDAALAMMKIVGDTSINGRAFGILPRSMVKSGYIDFDSDDYKEGGLMKDLNDKTSGAANRSFKT